VRTADLQPSPPVEDSPAEELVRQEVRPTPREQADNLFRDGLAALQQRRPQEAEKALNAALAIEPAHVGARDFLLRVLVDQHRPVEVRDLLAEGIRQVPQHLPWRIHFSRLLVEEGALDQARRELTREPCPAVSEAPDLYAMLATVHQRLGDHVEAARTYRQLLAVRPGQAVWWMGLGIALEGDASYNQAEQAYRQALSRGGLSEGLRAYVRQRLAVLNGRKPQQPAAGANPGWEQS
jgi:MSHA biogenesis protein MshN